MTPQDAIGTGQEQDAQVGTRLDSLRRSTGDTWQRILAADQTLTREDICDFYAAKQEQNLTAWAQRVASATQAVVDATNDLRE